jgi:hypothetical protein
VFGHGLLQAGWTCGTRVIRFGESLPIGRLFHVGRFYGVAFTAEKVCINLDKKWLGNFLGDFMGDFLGDFSRTRPVALLRHGSTAAAARLFLSTKKSEDDSVVRGRATGSETAEAPFYSKIL